MKDKQFLVTGYRLIDSPEYRKLMTKRKGMEMTYQWLRRNIVRAPMKDKYKNEVYDEYFVKRHLIAATIKEEKLAEDLFISRSTLRENLKDLNEAGFIKIQDLKTKTRGDGAQRPQKVYVLGKWITEINLNDEEEYKELMYVFDVINKSLFVDNDGPV